MSASKDIPKKVNTVGIPYGGACMVSDTAEALADIKCPFLRKKVGGSGAVGCASVIICPARTYQCTKYPQYELSVKHEDKTTSVLKCPECDFETMNLT